MPARRQRPRLRFAIADDCGDDEVRIVEGRAIGVRKRVAQFAALMDGAGRLRRYVAWNPPGNENWVKSRFMPSTSCEMPG